MNHDITHERLLSELRYDPETGEFTRRIASGRHGCFRAGSRVGSIDAGGYLVTTIRGKRVYLHRLAVFYMTGEWPTADVDHRDTDRGNNRWSNLRCVPRAINCQNRKRARKDSLTGLQGVKPNKDRFLARLTVDGVTHHLGSHATAQGAHQAYVDAKRRMHAGCTL